MTWVLDAGVLILAEAIGRLVEFGAWAEAHGCAVSEVVVQEMRRNSKSLRRADREWLDRLQPPALLVMALNGPESKTLSRLRENRTNPSNDLGEHEAIAWMYHRPDLLLVTHDRRAAWRAMIEVGPRVLSTWWWLKTRAEQMPPGLANDLLTEAARRARGETPLWLTHPPRPS